MTYSDFQIDIPKSKTTGQVYIKCPQCSDDRKKKSVKCLGVNLDLGIWHCSHCNWKGTINQTDKKTYVHPQWKNNTELPDEIVEFFMKRNIRQETLIEMKITKETVWMPQVEKKVGVIAFNYFREGKLVNSKYRDKDKNFRMIKDAELIIYNLDGIHGQKEIFLTEGEADTLVMVQSGMKNTCSVPNGANKNTNNLQYIDNCYGSFDNATDIYILTDNDEPGENLSKELSRRLGIERCYRVNLGEYKDVNDALNKGEKISREWILSRSKAFPLVGVYSASDFWQGLLNIRQNGFPKGWKPRGEIGKHVTIHPGYQTIITGIPGMGKGEFLDQVLLEISIDYDLRGAFFSPENHPTEMHLIKLVEKLSGKAIWTMSVDELNQYKDWIENRCHWIYPEDGFGLDNILEHVRKTVLRFGINWYVIDPWNKIDHQYSVNETKYISEVLDKLSIFNKKNNVHGFLVAHPTKMDKDKKGNWNVPTLYSISGSSHFFNKTDIGWTVHIPQKGLTEVHIQKVKFKYWGYKGKVDLTWDENNGRFYSVDKDPTDWIFGKPKTEVKQADIFDEPFTRKKKTVGRAEPAQDNVKVSEDDLPF